MMSQETFGLQLADAYEHVYDLVYLRSHPLLDLLVPSPIPNRKEQAWTLHNLLLESIEELNPGPQAPAYSYEWRRYKLMFHRYAEGLDPQAVADELAISRRHFYREREQALRSVSEVLWERVRNRMVQDLPMRRAEQSADRFELLRREAARMGSPNRQTHLPGIVQGVVSLASELAAQHGTWIECRISSDLPPIRAQRTILRQVLLGLASCLIEHARGEAVHVRAREQGSSVVLVLRCRGQARLEILERGRLAVFGELAASQGVQIDHVLEAGEFGFDLLFPTVAPPTVLVVDDNRDALQLFQRYLSHDYRVVTVQNSAEAIELAEELQPYAVTLDLMMPDQDGWETLQILANRPQTQHIPVVVCSVLAERELALALGAAAFLEKPISQQVLLGALRKLE